MNTYQHRQTSKWMVFILAALGGVIAAGGLLTGTYGLLGAALLLLVIAAGFTTLDTRVNEGGVSWGFTFGVPGGSIAFADISKVEITKTNLWLEGMGIHWTIWHGWLWNVAGYGAVIIHTTRGRIITLGTDDPQGLYDAIAQHIPQS